MTQNYSGALSKSRVELAIKSKLNDKTEQLF